MKVFYAHSAAPSTVIEKVIYLLNAGRVKEEKRRKEKKNIIPPFSRTILFE